MKRILSTMLVVAMMFALCVAAFAAVDTGKASCADKDNILDFYMEDGKKNVPTFTTDGELSFKNPAEGNTGCDCFIRRDGSLKEAYGSKVAFAFELCLNKIEGDTSKNPIFMIQIKDATKAWGANHKFFTITGDGAGAYVLADGNNEAATKTALKADTWYQFVIHFDLDADTAAVVGGEYGKTYTTLYTAKLNAKGDIPTILFGQGDARDGWKYDYLVDSLRLFSTSTSFEDGVNGQPYKAGIFESKVVLGDKTTPSSYKVSAGNKVLRFKQDGTQSADCALWISIPDLEDYTKVNVDSVKLTGAYGKTFKIEADYNVLTNGTDPFGFETKSKSGWFNKALPATAGWHHVTYTVDYDAGNFKVEVDGATIAEKAGDTGSIDYNSFKLGSMNTKANAVCEYLIDNVKITPAEGDALVIDFEDANVGDTKVGPCYAKTAHNNAENGLGVFVDMIPAAPASSRVKIYSAGGEANKQVDGIFEVRAPQGGGLFAAYGDKYDVEFDLQVITNNELDNIGIEWKNLAQGWVTPKIPVADNGVHRIKFTADKAAGTWTLSVDGEQKNSGALGEGTFDYSSLRIGSNNMRPQTANAESATPAFEYYIDNVLVTKADGTTLAENFDGNDVAFNTETGLYSFVYGKQASGTVSLEENVAEVPANSASLVAVDTTKGDGVKSDAMLWMAKEDTFNKVLGNCWKVAFKYIASNVGEADKLGIEWKCEKGWVTPQLPAADEWTDAEFIVDGVNGTWTLTAGGEEVAAGAFNPAAAAPETYVKIGCCNEKADNTFDFAIDDLYVAPIFCEAEGGDDTTTAEETTTAAATTAPDAPVNPGTGSVAGFIALVTVIAIGTGVVVSKKH